MKENKEKSIKLAIEAMRPLPVNSFAGYCSVSDDRSPEEKHSLPMPELLPSCLLSSVFCVLCLYGSRQKIIAADQLFIRIPQEGSVHRAVLGMQIL